MSPSAIDRMLRNGDWLRDFENVFRIAAAPITHDQRLVASCLRSPDKSLGVAQGRGFFLGTGWFRG
jgi:hypothetical protein